MRADGQDLFNIQPKRANWDLKRDMTNRMAKLDRKTNEAIATIFRESSLTGYRVAAVWRLEEHDIHDVALTNRPAFTVYEERQGSVGTGGSGCWYTCC
jgi:predicted secreted protein